MSTWINHVAYNLRTAIETSSAEPIIGQQAQELVHALGGTANISQMTPGAASLYLLSLMLSQAGVPSGGTDGTAL